MPRKSHRRKLGGSWKSFMGKASDFLKKSKLLSTVGRALAPMAGPYSGLAGKAVDYAEQAGYGRRRRYRRGGALRPVGARRSMGGMLVPVGGSLRVKHSGSSMSSRLVPRSIGNRMPMKF